MTNRSFATFNILKTLSIPTKLTVTFLFLTVPFMAHANPTNMGVFTTTKVGIVNDKWQAEGRYTAASTATGSSSWGAFTITREEMTGYKNNVNIQPSLGTTIYNGVEIENEADTSVAQDKFKYTFTIKPDESTSIHTIKIGQASYNTIGNSEIARQTLVYSQNPNINVPAQATIANNLSVPYFYNAMGDYFMGSRVSSTELNSQNTVSSPQLRTDSSTPSGSGLYYYNIPSLTGVNSTRNPYLPTVNKTSKEVSLNSNNGVLPPKPTFENIIKSINNGSTYSALLRNTTISNGGTYVSYGIENTQSDYVVAVKNASTVTLTYEGIMNGNIGIPRPVVGETFNEWISFGVESAPFYYIFSGTVFNDNGGNKNPQIDNAGYFNGIFDTTFESGVSNSVLKLVDCNDSNKIYASETILVNANDTGKYQLRTPIANLSGKSNVCLVEENSGSTYPVRTTNSKKQVDLITNKYFYDDNNFGRVTGENAALVLIKYQYVNNCPATIDYINISNTATDNPNTGFSTKPIDNIESGKCIAYKITATNRANLAINNFVMQDILQKKDGKSAMLDSKLIAPLYKPNDYASDSVAIGSNGMVKTKVLTLAGKSSYDFYFNTKYGTTQSN